MKKVLFILLILAVITKSYAQNYDLIVTTKGDSVACYIDSINDTHVHFRMKLRYDWIETLIIKEKVASYDYKVIDKKRYIFKRGTTQIEKSKPTEFKNHHTSRYIFGPSAIPLDKEDVYFNTHWGMIYDIQYGFTDRFSLRFGTDFLFTPIYFVASYSIPLNKHSHLAVGDLLLLELSSVGIWATGSVANMVYGQYTYEVEKFNLSFGMGFLATEDFIDKAYCPTFNISTQIKINDHFYFCSENYGFKYIEYSTGYQTITDTEVEFEHNDITWIGFNGIKYVGKRNSQNSWQFSFGHVLVRTGSIPDEYEQAAMNNDIEEGGIELMPLPLLSYSRKFGRRY